MCLLEESFSTQQHKSYEKNKCVEESSYLSIKKICNGVHIITNDAIHHGYS